MIESQGGPQIEHRPHLFLNPSTQLHGHQRIHAELGETHGSIHLLARYREEIGNGIGRNPALVRAARGTGRAVVVSCITLMLGFGVMLLSSFVPVRRFGELIGITVGMCLLSTLIVQPALLRVAAPKVAPNRFRKKS